MRVPPGKRATCLQLKSDHDPHGVGAVLVKAGSGWPAFNGAADAIRIAVTGGADVLYDLETQVPVELMSFSVE